MGTLSATPVRRGGLSPPRGASSGGGAGGASSFATFDRLLLALCLLVAVGLLYRLALHNDALPLTAGGSVAGAATVIATVRGGSTGGNVQAQLVLGRGGRLGAASAAATPRNRRAALRDAAKQRQQQQQQQLNSGRRGGPESAPLPAGLPPDFDAQVGAHKKVCVVCCRPRLGTVVHPAAAPAAG